MKSMEGNFEKKKKRKVNGTGKRKLDKEQILFRRLTREFAIEKYGREF